MDQEDLDFFNFNPAQSKSTDTESNSDFFDIPSPQQTWVKPEAPEVSEQLKTSPGLAAREFTAGGWSGISQAAEGYRFLSGKLQKYGEDLAAKEGREVTPEDKAITDKFVNYIPDLIQSLGEKFPNLLPTFEQAKKKVTPRIEKHTGVKLPEKARGAIERGAEGVAKGALSLAIPGSPLVKGVSLGTSVAGEALDLPEGQKLLANATVPALTSLVQAIATRRYIPSGRDAERIMAAGERLAMTNTELAPILATEEQVARHGRRAASIRGTREGFETTGHVLGDLVQQVQSQPGAAVAVGAQAEGRLLNQLQNIRQDMIGRTHALSPQEQNLLDFVENTITDIANNGSSPRQLIGTWRSVNRIGAGRTELRRILEPIREAIESVSPEIARDLIDTNEMYSRYIRNLQEIRPGAYNAFVDAGELQQLLGSVFTAEPQKGVFRFLTHKAFEKVSSLILTNPTAQSLVRNFGRAVRDGRAGSARALGIQFKEYLKDNLPEEYNEIDWKELGIEK